MWSASTGRGAVECTIPQLKVRVSLANLEPADVQRRKSMHLAKAYAALKLMR
jgi:hypothetical protein